MWDEIQDMPGEIFDMGDGSYMTEEDIKEGMKLLDIDDREMMPPDMQDDIEKNDPLLDD